MDGRIKKYENKCLDNNEAYNHQIRMSKEASCKVPRPKVIKVSDVYPSSNKIYMPPCTVLHVCADDTGCCGSPTLKCGPKSSHPVNLHFFVNVSISRYNKKCRIITILLKHCPVRLYCVFLNYAQLLTFLYLHKEIS